MRQPINLQPKHESDHPKLIKLWEAASCIDVRQTDIPEVLAELLFRNPACSYVAYAGTRLIGAQLVNAAVNAIKKEGISNVHCPVKRNNMIARQFWEACSFELRDQLYD
ncbi:MAG: hypothetical protein ACXW11_01880 [Methylotenera sp.]